MTIPVIAAAVLFGLAAGSFINVVIYRVPINGSIIKPRSYCPECRRTIRWYENIPVASYIFLKGRCRGCGINIPFRYPLVELVGAALAVLAIWRFGAGVDAAFAYAFLMALLAVTFIDWNHRIIPDEISLSFILIGLVWSLVSGELTVVSSAAGALAGGGGIWAVGALYKLIRHADGMGGGDVKLMAMIGAFLGVGFVLPVIVIASFFGSIYGIYLLRSGKEGKSTVAFGSFLAPAAAVCLLFGREILDWYLTCF